MVADLTSERLRLRQWTPDDVDFVFDLYSRWDLPASGDTEIGWHFHPAAWGLGYATEAAERVLKHAFAAGLAEVVAVTYPENRASQAVALRIGMTARGLTNRYYNATCALFRAGNPHPSDQVAD